MDILIKIVPHSTQRYNTVDDWQVLSKGEFLYIPVSSTGNEKYDVLIAVHGLIEAVLCKYRGISESEVCGFDQAHGKVNGEPGDHPNAPYHKEHVFAERIERMLAEEFGVDWDKYADTVDSL